MTFLPAVEYEAIQQVRLEILEVELGVCRMNAYAK
jgi:hypothetical protein